MLGGALLLTRATRGASCSPESFAGRKAAGVTCAQFVRNILDEWMLSMDGVTRSQEVSQVMWRHSADANHITTGKHSKV